MVMPFLNEEQTSAETIAEFRGYNHNPVTEQNEFYDMENMTGDKFPLIATRNKRGEDELEFTYTGYSDPTILCAYLKGDMRFVFFKFDTGLYNNLVWIRINDNNSTHGYRILSTGTDYVAGHHYIVAMGAQLILFPEKIVINIKEDFYDNTKYTTVDDYIEKIEKSVQPATGSYFMIYFCYDLLGNEIPYGTTVGTTAPTIQDTRYVKSTSDASDDSYDIYVYDTDGGYDFSGQITYNRIINTSAITTKSNLVNPPSEHWWWEVSPDGIYTPYRYDYRMGWTPYTTYAKIRISKNSGISEGDAVKIEGIGADTGFSFNEDVKSYIVEKVDSSDNSYDYIYVKVALKISPSGFSAAKNIKISRVMPNLDFVIEVNNRLWGCRFGTDLKGEYINEIFASKLGDPKNWYSFANTAEDSYYVSLANAGKFTGAVNYQNNPVFFRENCLHRITGSYPGNFRLNTMVCNGVKEGNNDSICILNDICYYMSPFGMCAYNGGIPISLAEAFGDIDYTSVKCDTSATCNELYCLITGTDNDGIYVFDDSKAFWHRESLIPIEQGDEIRLAGNAKEVIAYRHNNPEIDYLATQANSYSAEDDFKWFIQTSEIGYVSPYHKRLNKLVFKLKLAMDAKARIEIQYDRDGIWHPVNELRPTGKISPYSVPVSPQRCDTFSIKICGIGQFSLVSITKFWAEGSDNE